MEKIIDLFKKVWNFVVKTKTSLINMTLLVVIFIAFVSFVVILKNTEPNSVSRIELQYCMFLTAGIIGSVFAITILKDCGFVREWE
jgi:hypothetical protein